MDQPGDQMELNFDSQQKDGLLHWQRQRHEAVEKLARQLGLPLGHPVEVWIRGGIRLSGKLQFREPELWVGETRDLHLELMVDGVPFTPLEIESCVRLD